MKRACTAIFPAAAAVLILSCNPDRVDRVLPDIELLQLDKKTPVINIDYGLVAVRNKTAYEFYVKNKVTNSDPLNFTITALDGSGTAAADAVYTFEPVKGSLDGGQMMKVIAYFNPVEELAYNYTMLVESNAVYESNRKLKIPLIGKGMIPVLTADKTRLDFGEVYLGSTKMMEVTLGNIGTGPLTISDIQVVDPGGVFLLLEPASDSFPVKIPIGEEIPFKATFGPIAEAAYDGTFIILNDDPANRQFPISVTGVGVPPPHNKPPVAVITCPEGGIAMGVPGEIQLDGTQSYDPDNNLPLAYTWTMRKDGGGNEYAPEGSNWCYDCNRGRASHKKESAKAQPQFFGDLVGDYEVQLVVTDSQGLKGKPAYCRIKGHAAALIHIELLGSNPVSDLDLHLINFSNGVTYSNPFEPKGFYSCPCDCYPAGTTFKTNNPDWGIRIPYTADCLNPNGNACDEVCRPATPPADAGITCSDSEGAMPPECFKGGKNCVRTCTPDVTVPYLQAAIDDNPQYGNDWTDSRSPENIDVVKPSVGRYRILVYFFQANGGGSTDATVRLYIKGQTKPEWQFGPQELQNAPTYKKLWEVAIIEWAGEQDQDIAIVPCSGTCITDVSAVPDAPTCTIPHLDGGYGSADGG